MLCASTIMSVLAREGGYVNHPNDRGGPTNLGVTKKTLEAYREREVTDYELRSLSTAEAVAIYRENYWIAPGFHQLGLGDVTTELVFDTAVHSGPRQATKMLQRAAGVKADGIIGPITTEAVQRLEGPHLAALFVGERLEFIANLVSMDKTQIVFLRGWASRLRDQVLLIPLA